MKIKILTTCVLICCTVVLAEEEVYGFHPDNTASQLAREAEYASQLGSDRMRDYMERMTVRPHNLGSPQAKINAEMIADWFREWGYEVEIEVFHVLFPTPNIRELKQLRPLPFTASLTEQIIGSGPIADALRAEALPPYNAYSADGEVTGELVYVNQGIPRDYEELERRGIDVKGKIVIARYGGSWRGIKVKVAAEHGAIGCLIYNDPLADGFTQGAAYPNGAYKHDSAVQRGSVIDMPLYPGDPLTPGYGATKDAKRLSIEESKTIMKIPVLPISSLDAEPLLRTLDGPVAPDSWRGALPLTYRMGGDGGTIVRLKTEFSWDLVPTYNVIAKMEGSDLPDEWVIRGNHHDAWVIGARDPMSGLVTLLEQARAFGKLAKEGWRPKRTVVFCAWDGEEPGLLGSTEWAEHHRDWLGEHAVAYINTDGNSRGFLGIGGSHALETMSAQVAKEVIDPQMGVTVSERRRARILIHGTPDQKKKAKNESLMRINALGSGSDYSTFLQHLGIATLNVGFGGEGSGGEYHTCFDTFDHYSRFIDPGFEYARALSEVCGRLTLRLLDADVLPFDFSKTHRTISEYADEVQKLAEDTRKEIEEFNNSVENNLFVLAADPSLPYVAPEKKDAVPFFNFSPLQNAVAALDQQADAYSKSRTDFLASNSKLSIRDQRKIDEALYLTEREFLDPNGLPRRPWFRHRIYAPGFYTGYGVKTLPGVREGLEEHYWQETQEQIVETAKAIERFASTVGDAAEELSAATRRD